MKVKDAMHKGVDWVTRYRAARGFPLSAFVHGTAGGHPQAAAESEKTNELQAACDHPGDRTSPPAAASGAK
jgi:hypothetical protein